MNVWKWLGSLRLPRTTTRTVEVFCDGGLVASYSLTFLGDPTEDTWFSEAAEEFILDRRHRGIRGELTFNTRPTREGDEDV